MTDEPFGRQPQPVTVTIEGDPRDVEAYLRRIQSLIERDSYDHAVKCDAGKLTIYPKAVND